MMVSTQRCISKLQSNSQGEKTCNFKLEIVLQLYHNMQCMMQLGSEVELRGNDAQDQWRRLI